MTVVFFNADKQIGTYFFVENIMWICATITNSIETNPAYVRTFLTITMTCQFFGNLVFFNRVALISKVFVLKKVEVSLSWKPKRMLGLMRRSQELTIG